MANPTFTFKEKHRISLKTLLWPAQTKCNYIYIALGFDPTDLDGNAGPSNQLEDLYMTVIENIINKGVSKQQLVAALRSDPVGHGQLADKLENDEGIKDGVNGKSMY